MASNKISKGSKFAVVETAGLQAGNYNLFDIRGLSKGKLLCIKFALENYDGVLSQSFSRRSNSI